MIHRTRAKGISSLKAAAFQVVNACDRRGLSYRVRKDIPSMGWLSRAPIAGPAPQPRGRLKGLLDITTVT